ncbi:MAG: 3-hydroxybutyryl-CoA dehydrogenase [Pseudomonadales bacterium]|jgi:3-hydroxybutyryl-CoA dehydrogenase|nr:3-hydroxybutyryl-CoA dehydrogenase [Gammaproteobacteria bacterium]MBP6052688.1 3-hydroxybutyryl-CoA dehydrogenase [Pseudomonadales bacterium]MBK6583312.1 3-hydroxybutyryl-CoA dehydrogenase [Gammaproteobacteria bacterium]MBK7170857.1 3-hydroxybutyryl-CoA dehydrogenase [Gammaproteobacteria bacterium]MBK7519459.1 3-hydroxybutyryl-CoA dehydrogenase [Gammaproteobacteria bacterium]
MNACHRPLISVVGAGRMGRGIALFFAYSGYPAWLIDSEARPAAAFLELQRSVITELGAELQFLQDLDIVSGQQVAAILARIRVLEKPAGEAVLADADFVFEAVAEVPEIKQHTYAWMHEHVGANAIVASTTSTMTADSLAVQCRFPARFANAHWLNPAYLMPLVEISPAAQTGDATVGALRKLLEGLGKVTVLCRSSPGYIVSRIQALAMNEAARLVEEGVASAEDIDKATRIGFGIRYAVLGMLEFIDWGGGDILYHASNYLAQNIDEQRFSPPDIVRRNMEQGRGGLRDGKGFYDYGDIDVDAYRRQRLGAFVRLLQHSKLMPHAAGDSN